MIINRKVHRIKHRGRTLIRQASAYDGDVPSHNLIVASFLNNFNDLRRNVLLSTTCVVFCLRSEVDIQRDAVLPSGNKTPILL